MALVERWNSVSDVKGKASIVKKLEQMCDEIDVQAKPVTGSRSLIDGSSYSITVPIGVHRQSQVTIPHVNLTSGDAGLGLRRRILELSHGRDSKSALEQVQYAFGRLEYVGRVCTDTNRWLAEQNG